MDELEEKQMYRDLIIGLVNKIDRIDMLEYLAFFIKHKFKVG